MRYLDQVTGMPPHHLSPARRWGFRQHGIAGFALALVAALPVVVWSSDGSTGENSATPVPVVNLQSSTDPQKNEQPVSATASSPPGEIVSPAEVDTSQASSDKYDLALGKSVFNHTCLTCHGNSVRDAPRVGDMHVWQPRLAQGLDVLIRHALDGHGRMPAKGGYTTLTDYEVSSAVAYVYQIGSEILAKQDNPAQHEGCDPVSNLDQCSPSELKRLLVLQMLWLLGGPRQ
jgi:cytochrome c5